MHVVHAMTIYSLSPGDPSFKSFPEIIIRQKRGAFVVIIDKRCHLACRDNLVRQATEGITILPGRPENHFFSLTVTSFRPLVIINIPAFIHVY